MNETHENRGESDEENPVDFWDRGVVGGEEKRLDP
jgi:hypothetical protein